VITHVFFDNDGILVDTEHLYFEASRRVLAARDIELREADYIQLFLRENRGLLHYADIYGWTTAELDELRRTRNAIYTDLLVREARVIDGVRDVLDRLYGRCRMAIVTSAYADHFELVHSRTNLLHYFDFVLKDGDYAASKPHPAPYLTALARSGAAPETCLVVEDSERGLAAATAAGLRCVIVPSRLTRGERFEGAWRVLDDIRELPGLIDEA
jgi:HAD superfamily hydrolase (TIGR01509 family)